MLATFFCNVTGYCSDVQGTNNCEVKFAPHGNEPHTNIRKNLQYLQAA